MEKNRARCGSVRFQYVASIVVLRCCGGECTGAGRVGLWEWSVLCRGRLRWWERMNSVCRRHQLGCAWKGRSTTYLELLEIPRDILVWYWKGFCEWVLVWLLFEQGFHWLCYLSWHFLWMWQTEGLVMRVFHSAVVIWLCPWGTFGLGCTSPMLCWCSCVPPLLSFIMKLAVTGRGVHKENDCCRKHTPFGNCTNSRRIIGCAAHIPNHNEQCIYIESCAHIWNFALLGLPHYSICWYSYVGCHTKPLSFI